MKKSAVYKAFLLFFGIAGVQINQIVCIYMFPRPAYHSLALRNGVGSSNIIDDHNVSCANVHIIPFYQASRNNQFHCGSYKNIQENNVCFPCQYFLFDGKTALVVKSGETQEDILVRDVRAEWLEIAAPDFNGTLSLCPEQKQYGALIVLSKDLKSLIDWDFFETWWVEFSVPVVKIKNKLNVRNSSPEIVQALSRNNLNYSRLVEKSQKSVGLAELRSVFGSTYLDSNGFLLDYYTGIALPTERKPHATNLFSPSRGNNGHVVLVAGIHAKLPVVDCWENFSTKIFFNAENNYYFHNHQLRTFDLKGCGALHGKKPWSRYLLVRRKGELKTLPATEVLTFKVKVSPHSFFELSTGLECESEQFRAELGYSLWAHQKEHIEFLDHACGVKSFLFEAYGIAGTGTNSASASTIQKRALDDKDDDGNDVFVIIKAVDIDLESGGAQSGSSHRIHGALYYKSLRDSHRMVFGNSTLVSGVGFFYEWPRSYTALKNCGVWGILGLEF